MAALPLYFVLICCVCRSLLSSAQRTLGLIYSHSRGIVLTLRKKWVCMQNHCCIYETWILAYFVLTVMCKLVNQNCTRPLVLNNLIQFPGHYLHTARSNFPLEGNAFTSKWSGESSGDVVREKPSHLRQETRNKLNNSVWGPRTKQQVSTGVKTVWIWKWINTYMIS